MAYLPSDLSNHISEIHAFKPIENEKSRSSGSGYLIGDNLYFLPPARKRRTKQKLQGYYIQNAFFRPKEPAFAL